MPANAAVASDTHCVLFKSLVPDGTAFREFAAGARHEPETCGPMTYVKKKKEIAINQSHSGQLEETAVGG